MGTPEIAAAAPQNSPWHSPVPYLFGGLAAMVGLITFAVVILACSYWNSEVGEEDDGGAKAAPPVVVEEKYLVIMAGHDKPTFLATPIASSFSNKNSLPFQEKIKSGGIEMANY